MKTKSTPLTTTTALQRNQDKIGETHITKENRGKDKKIE
jgi:hypothetical protein